MPPRFYADCPPIPTEVQIGGWPQPEAGGFQRIDLDRPLAFSELLDQPRFSQIAKPLMLARPNVVDEIVLGME